MDECDLEAFRSLFEELVVEALDVEEDGVPVVLPRLCSLSKKSVYEQNYFFDSNFFGPDSITFWSMVYNVQRKFSIYSSQYNIVKIVQSLSRILTELWWMIQRHKMIVFVSLLTAFEVYNIFGAIVKIQIKLTLTYTL